MKTTTALLVVSASILLLITGPLACSSSADKAKETGGSVATASPEAVAPSPASQPTPIPTAAGAATQMASPLTQGAPAGNVMAVDADAASASIDNTTTQPLGTPFDIAINVASATNDFNTYQFKLQWDSSVLSYVSATHLNPEGYSACFDFDSTTAGAVGTACGRPGTSGMFVAATDRVTLQCEKEGVSVLHLVTLAEDPLFGTSTILVGSMVATATADASVTCR